MLPHFPLIVTFAARSVGRVGIGTLIATMLPYSIAFIATWSGLLILWILLELPMGPGSALFLPR